MRRRKPKRRLQPHAFHVRAAQTADAWRLAALSTQLGYPSSPREIRRRLAALRRDPRHAVAVAESSRGQVVGWVHVFIHRVLESENRAELGGLVVDEKFRGAGIGAQLVEWAERWARSRRLGSVYLRSNIIRRDAHRFYEKLGYRIIKTQHALLKKL